jgi:hypothetical protein
LWDLVGDLFLRELGGRRLRIHPGMRLHDQQGRLGCVGVLIHVFFLLYLFPFFHAFFVAVLRISV